MKRNRVTDQLLKECPKCGDLANLGDKDCAGCGAPLMKLTWTPEEITSEAQEAGINEGNRKIAQEFVDNSPEIVSTAFPGSKKPEEEKPEVKGLLNRWLVFEGTLALGNLTGSLLAWAFIGEKVFWMFFLVIGIMAVIAILFTRRYLKDRDKTAIALSNGDSYKALIVSVGDKIVQYGKQYRTLNVVADMDGRTVCVRVNVNYVPDDMCDTFYPMGKEVTLIGRNDSLAVVLES